MTYSYLFRRVSTMFHPMIYHGRPPWGTTGAPLDQRKVNGSWVAQHAAKCAKKATDHGRPPDSKSCLDTGRDHNISLYLDVFGPWGAQSWAAMSIGWISVDIFSCMKRPDSSMWRCSPSWLQIYVAPPWCACNVRQDDRWAAWACLHG